MRVARRGGRGGLTWPGVGALVGSPGGGRKAEREAALGECGWHPRDRGQAAWPFLSPACSPHHAPSPPPPPPGDPGCHRPRPTPPPTPRVVLARIPAFLFRLTSPPRRREAGPRVDPGLFGGGRAVPCPPNPRASLSPVARPWLPRGVFGASRDGLCPPAAGSGPGFLPAVGPPCLRSTAPILPPLGPGPLSLSSAAAAAAALLAVGAVVGRRPSGSRVTGRQCHVRPAFRGRAARRTEFVTRRQGRRSLGAPGCGAFPPSLPRLARLPLSRYLARPGAEV